MCQLLGVGEVHSIGMHAAILLPCLRRKREKHVPPPLDLDAARSGNEVQYLLRLTCQMHRHRPCNAVVHDQRQLSHTRYGEQDAAHISACHVDGYGCGGRGRREEQCGGGDAAHQPWFHTVLLPRQCDCAGRRAERR